MIRILRAGSDCDIRLLAKLACEIWNERYVVLIGQAQVDYMLEKFQSPSAIERQIDDGYEYYLVYDDRADAGYFALVHDAADQCTQLSKIYVRRQWRGRGIGRAIIQFASQHCIERGARELWLTVNKHNVGSIAFYERMGFVNAGGLVTDIGNGFVMDDYRMVKPVAPTDG